MKKNYLGLIVGFMVLIFGASALAQDGDEEQEGRPVVPAIVAIEELESEGVQAEFDAVADTDESAPRQPASPLTEMWVFAVYSSDCGDWEIFPSPGTLSTSCGHGGASLRAAVLEVGYGSNPIAWYQGGQLPSSANYETELWCDQGGGVLAPCSPGQTVAAFLRYYNLDGSSVSGIFAYQNTSTNSPWNTLSTSINILP
ncbi:DUF4879 domain-containing protein [Billgrantia endophytica]|nr:DUF4879 domain-containing protein [Halomonas endophytica]